MRRLEPEPAEVHDVDAFVAAAARPAPEGRPWLLVNMIASLDGSITVDGRSGSLARPADREMFFALRGIADVVLAGAGTVRAEGYGPARPSPTVRAAREGRGQAEVPRIAVLTRRLELDLTTPLFTASPEPPIILTCETAPPDRRAAAAEVADVIVAGDASVDLPAAMAALHDRGIRTVTCEGGPQVNGDLLLADLVDEWCLTISPLLVGGDDDRAIVGPRPPAPRDLHLDWVLEGDGLLLTRWLRVR